MTALRSLLLLAGIVMSSTGCAEQLQLLDRGPTGGVSPCSFWPPPRGATVWIAEPPRQGSGESLRSVARELELALRSRGYVEQRWYPIGTANSHGFAVTTRVEQTRGSGGQEPRERWSSLYGDAASLRWVMQARTVPLPGPGRYRVFLVAYTDLPLGQTSAAPTWNEDTVMDWPNAEHGSSSDAVPARRFSSYELGVYEYEYVWDDAEDRGKLRPPDKGAASGERPPFGVGDQTLDLTQFRREKF